MTYFTCVCRCQWLDVDVDVDSDGDVWDCRALFCPYVWSDRPTSLRSAENTPNMTEDDHAMT